MVDGELTVRVAADGDGERIGALVRSVGFKDDGIDWARVHPFWIVVETGGRVIGAVQVLYGLPVGRLEFMAVEPSIDGHRRGRIVRRLLVAGCATLARGGATMAAGTIPFDLKSYKRALKKRDAVVLSQGNVIGKRLAQEVTDE